VVALTEAGAPQNWERQVSARTGNESQRSDWEREARAQRIRLVLLPLKGESLPIKLPKCRQCRRYPASYEWFRSLDSTESKREVLLVSRFHQQHRDDGTQSQFMFEHTLPCSALLHTKFPTSSSAGRAITIESETSSMRRCTARSRRT
jgi:hypothetical protein